MAGIVLPTNLTIFTYVTNLTFLWLNFILFFSISLLFNHIAHCIYNFLLLFLLSLFLCFSSSIHPFLGWFWGGSLRFSKSNIQESKQGIEMEKHKRLKRVVIVGGGVAGCLAAKNLQFHAHVTLVDP